MMVVSMYYSVDFRQKVLDYAKTHTIKETAKTFGISKWAVSNWKKLLKDTGSLKCAPLNRKPRKMDYAKLKEYVDANPDKYLREIAEVFHCAKETVRQSLIKIGYTLKKRPNYTKSVKRKNVRSIQMEYLDTERKI
ncbi:MAG: transposase [Holosporales bacterium]|jgi:transposase|nr:transposase [Holosporales bacterium]